MIKFVDRPKRTSCKPFPFAFCYCNDIISLHVCHHSAKADGLRIVLHILL